jgi:hypothetical protein
MMCDVYLVLAHQRTAGVNITLAIESRLSVSCCICSYFADGPARGTVRIN